MGICVNVSGVQISHAVGSSQYGAGRSAGAELEIAEVRAAAAIYPEDAVLGLDMKNAFGAVSWADALPALVAHLPKLAVPLALQLSCFGIIVYLKDVDGQGWHCFKILGSLVQGDVEAHSIFCVVIAIVAARVHADTRIPATARRSLRSWLYVDDWVLQAKVHFLAILFEVIREHAAPLGLSLQARKYQVHVPALIDVPSEEWPAELLSFVDIVPHQQHGFTLLGTEACGGMSTPLYADQAHPHVAATAARAQRAVQLAHAVVAMVRAAPPAGARQGAWAINRGIICHSLTYDARVLPCSHVLPHAAAVDDAVLQVVTEVLGVREQDLSEGMRSQLVLPTRRAGLQVDMPSKILPLARAASLMEVGPALRMAIRAWAPPGINAKAHDGVDVALREGVFERVITAGIQSFGGDGRPQSMLRDATPERQLRPPVPARHLFSAFLAHKADYQYEQLLLQAGDADRVRLRSAAGPTAGKSLVCSLAIPGVAYNDRDFQGVLRWRLGLAHDAAPCSCRNWNRSKEEECGEALSGDHAADCPCGPLTVLRHEGLADVWANVFEEIGGVPRRELFVAELSTPNAEAWLDIAALGVPELAAMLFDVTVRHPRADRYLPAAVGEDGAAMLRAAAEKADRYPDASGRRVVTLGHETWGRLAVSAECMLQLCAEVGARRDHRRGRLPGNRLSRWRAQLDASLQRAVAAQLNSARWGLPGREPRRKRRAVDTPSVECRHGWPAAT